MSETDSETDPRGDGGRWLTYAELAEARGITRKAAVRMTQRHRWRKTPGNDGAVRIYVPDATTARLRDRDARLDAPHDVGATDGMTPFHARALDALEDALAALRQAKDGEIAALHVVIDGLRSTVARAEERAAHAERRATALDGELAEGRTRAEQLKTAAQEALRAAEAAQIAQAEAQELRTTIDELKAGQAMVQAMRARELDQAKAQAQEAQEVAEELREADEARKARGRLRRAWDGWRGR